MYTRSYIPPYLVPVCAEAPREGKEEEEEEGEE